MTLDCWVNQLTTLDVTTNMALTSLNCSSNNLRELDLSRNSALTELYCSENQLKHLDLTHNASIKELEYQPLDRKKVKLKENLEDLPVVRNVLSSLAISSKNVLQLRRVYEWDMGNFSISSASLIGRQSLEGQIGLRLKR